MTKQQVIEILTGLGFLLGHAQRVNLRGWSEVYRTVVAPPVDTVTYSHAYNGVITNVNFFRDHGFQCTLSTGVSMECSMSILSPDLLYYRLVEMGFLTNSNY